MPAAEQLQMRLPIHVSHQSAVELLWSACRIHFHCATINVHGYVTQLTCEMPFQLRSTLLFSVRANKPPLEYEVPTLSWKLYMNILQSKLQVIICCNLRLIYYPGIPFSTHSTPQKRQ